MLSEYSMKKIRYIVACCLMVTTIILVGCGSTRVNIDMTKLNSYAVQSEVFKMQKSSTANDYIGKTIKMRAKPYSSGDYHYIIGPDGDECCNWEIEIRLGEGLEDYPKNGKNTYVTGVYKYYKEGTRTYYYLELSDYT